MYVCAGGEGNSKSFKCSCLKPLCVCLYLLWTYSLPLGLCFQIWISLGGMFWPTYFALRIYLAKFCRNNPTVPSQSCHLLFCPPPSRLPSMRQKPPARVLHLWSGLSATDTARFSVVGRAQRLHSPVLPLCCWLGSAARQNLGQLLRVRNFQENPQSYEWDQQNWRLPWPKPQSREDFWFCFFFVFLSQMYKWVCGLCPQAWLVQGKGAAQPGWVESSTGDSYSRIAAPEQTIWGQICLKTTGNASFFLAWTQLRAKVALEYWLGMRLPCICCLLQEEIAKLYRYLSYDKITEDTAFNGLAFLSKARFCLSPPVFLLDVIQDGFKVPKKLNK